MWNYGSHMKINVTYSKQCRSYLDHDLQFTSFILQYSINYLLARVCLYRDNSSLGLEFVALICTQARLGAQLFPIPSGYWITYVICALQWKHLEFSFSCIVANWILGQVPMFNPSQNKLIWMISWQLLNWLVQSLLQVQCL